MRVHSLGPAVAAAVLETERAVPVDTEVFTREVSMHQRIVFAISALAHIYSPCPFNGESM